jgi:6-phosphofructokinase
MTINIINQDLGYRVRGGNPDAVDSITPMTFGNLALDLQLKACTAGGTHETARARDSQSWMDP